MCKKKLTKKQVASKLVQTYKIFQKCCEIACEQILKDNDMWYCESMDVCVDHNNEIIEEDRNGDEFVAEGLFPPMSTNYLKTRSDIEKFIKTI